MIDVAERAVAGAAAAENRVHLQAVVPGEDEQQHAGEHREMPTHIAGDIQSTLLPAQTGRERVKQDHESDDDQHHGHRPGEQ